MSDNTIEDALAHIEFLIEEDVRIKEGIIDRELDTQVLRLCSAFNNQADRIKELEAEKRLMGIDCQSMMQDRDNALTDNARLKDIITECKKFVHDLTRKCYGCESYEDGEDCYNDCSAHKARMFRDKIKALEREDK